MDLQLRKGSSSNENMFKSESNINKQIGENYGGNEQNSNEDNNIGSDNDNSSDVEDSEDDFRNDEI